MLRKQCTLIQGRLMVAPQRRFEHLGGARVFLESLLKHASILRDSRGKSSKSKTSQIVHGSLTPMMSTFDLYQKIEWILGISPLHAQGV
jgi:hypothetical protein